MKYEPDEGAEDFSGKEFLIPRFNTLHMLAQEQIRNNDQKSAKSTYSRMLRLYDDINKSSIHSAEKQKAYGKLMYVFTAISGEDYFTNNSGFQNIISTGKYILPISLVIIVLIIIFFLRPQFSLTGFAVLGANSAPEWAGEKPVFDIKGETSINLGNYFRDADRDILEYSITDAPGLEMSVEGSILNVKPLSDFRGLRVARITASDSSESASVLARFKVQK